MNKRFPRDRIKALVFEYLAKNEQGQFGSIIEGIVNLAKKYGLYSRPKSDFLMLGHEEPELDAEDNELVSEEVRQLMWELLVRGILVFGMNKANPNWPFYRITKYGKKVLQQQGPQPYDPDSFLAEFQANNPKADEIVLGYLTEAIQTFNLGCFQASAVMLGCASEQMILNLLETFIKAIKDDDQKKDFAKSYKWTILSKFQALQDNLEILLEKKIIPKEFREIIGSNLPIIFRLIRNCRNSAGHPDLPNDIRRETVFVNLIIFPEYVFQVGKLITYFEEHSVTFP